MARTPGFTAVAVLMIALGTGANAAMFSVIDGVMLRSPFSELDRIAIVQTVSEGSRPTFALSHEQYRALLTSAPVFESIAALGLGQPILTGAGAPRRLTAECVTAGMFRVLGAAPEIGRTFLPEEDRPGAPSVILISHDFWQRDLGGYPDIVGRVIALNAVPATIVGVMPRRFAGPYSRNTAEAWLPLGPGMDTASSVGCAAGQFLNAFARVRPGVPMGAAAAQAKASTGFSRIPDADGKAGADLVLIPIEEQTFSELRTPFLTLLAAVGLVLLIACANVANLQLERVFGRRVELAVRMALGATRARLVSQTLTENLLLSVLGGAAGLLAARWTLGLVVGLMPPNVPHLTEIAVSGRILAATLLVACVAGLSVGVAPALQGSSTRLMDDLRASTRSSKAGGGWTRSLLVIAQVSLSLMLLVGAALTIATFTTLRPADPGFYGTDKLTASVRLQGPAANAPAKFFADVFERLRTEPGVRSVAGSTYLPMSGFVGIVPVKADETTQTAWSGLVTPTYFSDMRIPLVRGRAFEPSDDAGAPLVTIVNEALARKMWPAGDALGRTIEVARFDRRKELRQVIGVIRDTRSMGGDLKGRGEIYTPFAQAPYPLLNLIVSTSAPADPQLAARIRSIVSNVDPTQVVDRIFPLQGRWSTGRLLRGASTRGSLARSPRWRCCWPPSGWGRRSPGGSRSARARSVSGSHSARGRLR
jgi:putative ABC transport system permease protein